MKEVNEMTKEEFAAEWDKAKERNSKRSQEELEALDDGVIAACENKAPDIIE